MQLYFARHGQTNLNKYGRMQGWADTPLTSEGEKLALETGERLSHISFDAVYTSDFWGTKVTARLNLSKNQYEDKLIAMKELRETCFGSFEGEKDKIFYQQVADKHGISLPEVFTRLDMETISEDVQNMDSFGDAELFSSVLKRVLNTLEMIASQQLDAEKILIVTHGNSIRLLIKRMGTFL